jgi:TrpR family transcriptional regulator, trp operon repressor
MLSNKSQLDSLIEALLSIKDQKVMEEFLLGLLTQKELEELPTRLSIVKMLKKGLPQHKIAEQLNVGIATVTRGSKELQKGRFSNI